MDQSTVSLLIDIAGWTGAVIVLAAYALVSARKLPATSAGYHALNIIGAIPVGLNAWYYRALPSLTIEVAWMLVAMIALAQVFRWKSLRDPVPEATS